MTKTLKVTGTCYESNCNLVLGSIFANWILVHGMPTLQRAPFTKYGHAWLEDPLGESVFDAEKYAHFPKDEYYRVGKIDPADNLFRYTRTQARHMILHYRHWGPWEGIEGCPPISRRRR